MLKTLTAADIYHVAGILIFLSINNDRCYKLFVYFYTTINKNGITL